MKLAPWAELRSCRRPCGRPYSIQATSPMVADRWARNKSMCSIVNAAGVAGGSGNAARNRMKRSNVPHECSADRCVRRLPPVRSVPPTLRPVPDASLAAAAWTRGNPCAAHPHREKQPPTPAAPWPRVQAADSRRAAMPRDDRPEWCPAPAGHAGVPVNSPLSPWNWSIEVSRGSSQSPGTSSIRVSISSSARACR